jgi:hypothetical protein
MAIAARSLPQLEASEKLVKRASGLSMWLFTSLVAVVALIFMVRMMGFALLTQASFQKVQVMKSLRSDRLEYSRLLTQLEAARSPQQICRWAEGAGMVRANSPLTLNPVPQLASKPEVIASVTTAK